MSEPQRGTQPLRPGALVVVGLLALVAGWAVRWVYAWTGAAEPLMSWWAVAVMWLLALGVTARAWQTWRRLQRHRDRLEPYKAVNRLVLGQASALAGVALFAGHLGTMGSRLGVPVTELTGDRLWRAGVAALGGLVLLAAGLWLERACRVPEDDDAV